MSIREYFCMMYANGNFDEVADFENQVFDWYMNDDPRFDEFVEQNDIDIYAVENMIGGIQEYTMRLWAWDMCGE